TDAPLWGKDFLGGDGDPQANYAVKDGPFRQGEWKLVFDGPDLRRRFGHYADRLPTPEEVGAALLIESYDCPPYDVGSDLAHSFPNYMAGWNHPSGEPEMHNRVHNWVGGSMLIMTSPNDPVFWLVHANLDRLWAEWEAVYGDDFPEAGAPRRQNLRDPTHPFGVPPEDVLDHHDLGYAYDTETEAPSRASRVQVVSPGRPERVRSPCRADDLHPWFR